MPKSKTKPKHSRSRVELIGNHFDEFQMNGSHHKALCPVHDDENPSLSIKEGDDGRILLHCFAGCSTPQILEVVGLSMNDLMPDTPLIAESYDYRDEQGEFLFQVVRYDPKDFRQRKPKPGGGWDWRTKGVRRVLYRLPELLDADLKKLVFIPEGEKDVDRL